MRRRKIEAITLISAISLPLFGCTGPNAGPVEGGTYTVAGTIAAADEDHFTIIDTDVLAQQGNMLGALDDDEITVDDNYKDVNCIGHETSDDLDLLLEAGKLAVGVHVIADVSMGVSKENCLPLSNNGHFANRSLLTSLAVVE